MDYKRISALILATVLLVSCGQAKPVDRYKDPQTGKSYPDTVSLLEDKKKDNPHEYDVVYELSKEEPKAFEIYASAIDAGVVQTPKETLYFDDKGNEIAKDVFIKTLEFPDGFENVVQNYYDFLSRQEFAKCFGMIDPKGPLMARFENKFDIYSAQQLSSRLDLRVVSSDINDYRMQSLGDGNKMVEVYFRVLGFFKPVIPYDPNPPRNGQETMSNPGEKPTPPPQPTGDSGAMDLNWEYRYSGVSKMVLSYSSGKWMIYDQQ
jgi:hypothetical protein